MGKRNKVLRRKVGESTLDKGSPPTLGQIQPFLTGQVTLHLNHNTITDRLSLVTRPKRHIKVLQGQRGSPVAQDDSQLSSIIHVANRNQEGYGQIDL
jgi:hypothetical protein